MSVPALRFKDEAGQDFAEWKNETIGDVLSIGSGKDYKHLSKGNVPVYGTGGYMLSVDKYLHDGESVCIGRKGTIDRPTLLNGKFWTVDTLFYTHSFKNCLPKFIYATFQRIDWKNYNEASGVPSLSKSTIEKIEISLPSKPEQTKIANFLTAVDEKITQLTQKHDLLTQYKKGVLQQIFSQELRFKDDHGQDFPEWADRNLQEFLIPDFREVNKPKGEYLSIGIRSHCKGTFQKPAADPDKNSMDKLFVVHHGDLIVNITFAWEGAIAIVKKEDHGGYVSHRFPTYIFNPEITFAGFFQYVFILPKFRETLELISPGGAGRNRVLSKKEFMKMTCNLPVLKEQTKIANFLTAIDDKITATQTQLQAVKQYKHGLLQQMFV